MRALVVFICTLLLACVPARQCSAPESQTALASDLADKTVVLVDPGDADEPNRIYCSGVWVSSNAFLTAAHCVGDASLGDDLAYLVEGDSYDDAFEFETKARPAKLFARDNRHDLALVVAAKAPEHLWSHVSHAPVVRGQLAFTMGAPLGMVWSFGEGEIAGVRFLGEAQGVDMPMYYVQSTAPISHGSSGGGLFDANGRLVGLAHGIFSDGELVNVFIHRDYIAAFLSAAHIT